VETTVLKLIGQLNKQINYQYTKQLKTAVGFPKTTSYVNDYELRAKKHVPKRFYNFVTVHGALSTVYKPSLGSLRALEKA
jgi:hypothetical protein